MNLSYIDSMIASNRSTREHLNRRAVIAESRVLSPYAILTAIWFGYEISLIAAKLFA